MSSETTAATSSDVTALSCRLGDYLGLEEYWETTCKLLGRTLQQRARAVHTSMRCGLGTSIALEDGKHITGGILSCGNNLDRRQFYASRAGRVIWAGRLLWRWLDEFWRTTAVTCAESAQLAICGLKHQVGLEEQWEEYWKITERLLQQFPEEASKFYAFQIGRMCWRGSWSLTDKSLKESCGNQFLLYTALCCQIW